MRTVFALVLAISTIPSAVVAQRPNAAAPTAPASTSAPAALEPLILRQTTFNIPFSVDPSRPTVEVQLFVSIDAGATWRQYARQRPTGGHFQFRAGRDGDFWFASRTIESDRTPTSVNQLRPELYVVVDTEQPKMQFDASVGAAGEVVTSWHIVDASLEPNTLKIEYQTGAGQEWQAVAVERQPEDQSPKQLSGKMTWWPETSAHSIVLRAEVSDRAGNKAVVNRQLALPKVASNRGWQAPTAQAGIPTDPFHRPNQPQSAAVAWPSDNRVGQRLTPAESSPASPAAENTLAANQFPAATTEVQPPVGRQVTVGVDAADSATRRSVTGGLPPGERPRMSATKRFQLDYEIDTVSPSGIRQVELWGTRDEGRTWTRWTTDQDLQSPIDVEVDAEGMYGFRIVIVGNNGLASPTPQNGELADLWVGVDVTQPEVKIASAIYGEGEHAGQLEVRWSADDDSFDDRPISLLFAQRPGGPWTTIASGLPNDGLYHWPIDPRVPDKIYLKIEARDLAGNTNSDQLTDPISISGLTPRARIRGVRPTPAPPSTRGVFRTPFYR